MSQVRDLDATGHEGNHYIGARRAPLEPDRSSVLVHTNVAQGVVHEARKDGLSAAGRAV
jgi:hypothetical protein